MNVGAQLALQAQVLDASGAAVSGATVFWSSSDTTIVTVTTSGVVTGKATGTARVAASSGGQSAQVVVTVSPVPVSSVAVLPSSATLVIGGSVTLVAVAYDANGNALTGRVVTWATSAPSVATVDGSGKVTAVTAGSATISGTSEGKTATSAITVTVIPVAAVSVNPSSAALNVGQSVSLAAIATDSHSNTLSGRPVTWSTANAAVATVSTAGLVSAIGAGTTTISATIEGQVGTAQVVVTSVAPPPPVPVASVAVTPGTASLNIGGTVTLSANVRDSNGSTLSGRVVTWSTSAPSIAAVSNTGVVTAVAPGSAAITATSETKSGSATITVLPVAPPTVASITVLPSTATLVQDSLTTIVATARDSAGNALTGRTITWVSSIPTVASVSTSGLVTALAPGNTGITATSGSANATAVVTVIQKPVATVTVSPATVSVIVGNPTTLVDTTYDGHGGVLTGRAVTWASSAPAVASVSQSGVVTTLTTGTTTISATSEGKVGTSTVTVVPVPVNTVTVSPSAASIAVGDSTTFVATLKDAGGNTLTGRTITWSSGTPANASVNAATGLVKGVAVGTSVITATSEGMTGTATVTVTVVPVASVTVSAGSSSIIVGATTQMTFVAKDASNNVLTGRTATWSSDTPGAATVNATTGLVTGVSAGTATITATVEGVTGSELITVNPVPVASVVITASPDSAIAGAATLTLTAQAFDANSNQLSGRTFTWTSGDPTIATVSSSTGASVTLSGAGGGNNGQVTITVVCEGIQSTVIITVSGQ